MRDHALFVGFAPVDNPRYAAATVLEHGGHGAHARRAEVARDVMTYLFDKRRAMTALARSSEQWGGDIRGRLARRADQWDAAQAARENDSGRAADRPDEGHDRRGAMIAPTA